MAANARLSNQELAEFRSDPRREEKLGITDHVVCRECGARLGMITGRHLKMPGHSNVPSLALYKQAWPEAPTIGADIHNSIRESTEAQWKRLEDTATHG